MDAEMQLAEVSMILDILRGSNIAAVVEVLENAVENADTDSVYGRCLQLALSTVQANLRANKLAWEKYTNAFALLKFQMGQNNLSEKMVEDFRIFVT